MEHLRDTLLNITIENDGLPAELKMSENGRFTTYYAPFEYMNTTAKLAICGITPGIQQAVIALKTLQDALTRGLPWAEAIQDAKKSASFAGAMRKNLAAMLDYIGLNQYLDIESCSDLFTTHSELVHYTSALRNPVLDSGKNYSGGSSMTTNEYLWQQISTGLKEEISALPADTLFIPLGTGVDEVFRKLIDQNLFSPDQVLFGLPHASGANSERIAYFCGKKERSDLSTKTNPEKIEAQRKSVTEHIDRLIAQKSVGAPMNIIAEAHGNETRASGELKIEYRVNRGKQAGAVYTPHQYADGSYIVSKTRFEKDQIKVKSFPEIQQYLDRGYALRMSDPTTRRSPSLVKPESINVTKIQSQ